MTSAQPTDQTFGPGHTPTPWFEADNDATYDEILADFVEVTSTTPKVGELPKLLDEHLAVLEGVLGGQRLVRLPTFEKIAEQNRDTALATALRSLVAQGAVRIENSDELDEAVRNGEPFVPVDLRLRPMLALLLDLRASAKRVLMAEQFVGAVREWWYLYSHGDFLTVLEKVTANGEHEFLYHSPAVSADYLPYLVDRFRRAKTDGEVLNLTTDDIKKRTVGPLAEAVEATECVTRLTALIPFDHGDPRHGEHIAAYSTPDALWFVHVVRPQDQSGIRAYTVSPDTLRETVARLVHGGAP
ncbi:hypothetical protein [Phytoactinopolyspora mesophila]|uniref:ESX secretion-associated protein EspG n=1 Tax=Phytoactinopolyspora mesophila TaxID=2650750 RepID=A0A7K3M577_9ACTN|nr:hypothetical protein [Phytoactinopolyspora mesophila]NDL58454.1 hypothetical protein [Phytoactinopolyspora mesophila]